MGIFKEIHSRINKNPGSEIPGVPASETSDIVFKLIQNKTLSIVEINFLEKFGFHRFRV